MLGPSLVVPRSESFRLVAENQIGLFSPELKVLDTQSSIYLAWNIKYIVTNKIFDTRCGKSRLKSTFSQTRVRNTILNSKLDF